ncbi:hypothetical protein SDC9_126100 [bioreactor metagenome]|uniref:Uncharacterized protein n=1 Tax=bioreactor metagenome TaxID=1076179 RepID=A0A645CQ91_9ZZZZ
MLAPAAIDHVHDAKTLADDESAAEQVLDLFGRGIGGHVEILGAQAQQQIAHGAADDVGLEARLLEGAHHVAGPFVYEFRIDAMHLDRHIHALAEAALAASAGAAGFLAQQFVDEGFDHGFWGNRSRMRQPFCWASARRRWSGLVATGCCTFSRSGTSFMESL